MVVLISHLICVVYLPNLVKDPKNREFSLKLHCTYPNAKKLNVRLYITAKILSCFIAIFYLFIIQFIA